MTDAAVAVAEFDPFKHTATCKGCDKLIPFGEEVTLRLSTPIGYTIVTLHRDRACAQAAREHHKRTVSAREGDKFRYTEIEQEETESLVATIRGSVGEET